MPRPLFEIAAEIRADWSKTKSGVWFGAVPYLDAMETLETVDDHYGLDTGKYIVDYFLANAQTWRGEVARRVKKELKALGGSW